jgi:cysteine desulfurase
LIYLDYNATSPVSPEVFEAMTPYLTSEWGNPSSTYKFGSKLKMVIETARAQVAELIGARTMEIVFTSCATESNNTAIHAALKANPQKQRIITSAVEHLLVRFRTARLPLCLHRRMRVPHPPLEIAKQREFDPLQE